MVIALHHDEIDLSVVVPSLNEAANLRLLLPTLSSGLRTLGITSEILVVDGGSLDGTEHVTQSAGAIYLRENTPGYGAAILRGVTEARGRYVLTMDADLSHPAAFVERLWHARERGDIVIASRYVEGSHAQQPWLRLQLSRVLNAFFRIGLSMPVRDMSSGFRLYRKRSLAGLDLTSTSFVILVEILLKAYAKGMRISEEPFHYAPRTEGRSNAKVLRFGLDYLRLFRRMWTLRNSIEFPDYDWRAYDSRIWFQRYWQRRRHDIVLGLVPRGTSVCDVGCGSSRILANLPQAVGVDLRHDKLAFMRRTNTRLLQADGLCLPFDDNTFDCVISSQVIEHIPNEGGRHIDELVRVLKPRGELILGTPDYGGWQWPLIERIYARVVPGAYADEHVTHYTFRSLCEALAARDCEILTHAYILGAELIIKAKKR